MVGWRGVKESVSMLQVVRDAVHGGCLKKGLPAQKKVGQRWRSESRGEFGIDVSGDLDRDDWFPDLHQDAGRYPSHLLSTHDLVPLLNSSAPVQILLASRSFSESQREAR
jgi:hypothetical protein